MCHRLSGNIFYLSALIVLASSGVEGQQMKGPHAAIRNPVFDRDFPDPTIVKTGSVYYGYATQSMVDGKMQNIQVAASADLQHWRPVGDALPRKPVWAEKTQDFWAPHVLFDAQLKEYVLFYSAESDDTATGKCIGVAFAGQPQGPFRDMGHPLVCGDGFVNIDPMAFIDPVSGERLLYWGSGFQPIHVQEMSKDWKSFEPGSKTKPVVWPQQDTSYSRLIEGAWVDFQDGHYYLYYSGDNCCGDNANYAVMVARADDPMGPFVRLGQQDHSRNSVILEKYKKWTAPGHNSIFRDDKGNAWIAYHAIRRKGKDKEGQVRVMCISPLVYEDGWPRVITE